MGVSVPTGNARESAGLLGRPASEIVPIAVENAASIQEQEQQAIEEQWHSFSGAAAVATRIESVDRSHALTILGDSLPPAVPCMKAIANEYRPDGTGVIEDRGAWPRGSLSLTAAAVSAHQDGIRQNELIAVTGLMCEVASASPCLTYVQNVAALALELGHFDSDLAMSLCEDGALTVINNATGEAFSRPVVRVTTGNQPQVFFRSPCPEYNVRTPRGQRDIARAVDFLIEYTRFGSPGSSYIALDHPGKGIFLNNRICVHGRTPFLDPQTGAGRRVAVRYWTDREDASIDEWAYPRSAQGGARHWVRRLRRGSRETSV